MIEHPTASAAQLQNEVAAGFAAGVIPSLAHYRTHEQSAAWHEVATSFFDRAPGRNAFDEVYSEIAAECETGPVHIIALGCGDGAKEEGLARTLRKVGLEVSITLVDISPSLLNLAMARQSELDGVKILSPVVCEVTTVGGELAEIIDQLPGRRVVTMFGVLPGLTSMSTFNSVAALTRGGDLFAFSGNLLPEGDGQIERLCEFYATDASHDWMALVFRDAGIADLKLRWSVTPAYTEQVHSVATVSVTVEVLEDCSAQIGDQIVQLHAGQKLDTFRSHRHSLESINSLTDSLGLTVLCMRRSDSGEEGVALARK